jgi:uncharacterized protein (DUF433 family)
MKWQDYIIINPNILAGKPVIKGTRLSAEFILGLLADGWDKERIIKNYPHLKRQAIQAVLAFASEIIKEEHVYPVKV